VMARLFASGARAVVVSPSRGRHCARDVSRCGGNDSNAGHTKGGATPTPIGPMRLKGSLAEMCADILGVEAMGPNDEFLSYGGGSLTGVRLFALIRRELGADLSLSALLQAPTIRELAVLVRANSPQPVEQEQPKPAPEPAAEAPAVRRQRRTATSSYCARRSKWKPLVRMAPGDPSNATDLPDPRRTRQYSLVQAAGRQAARRWPAALWSRSARCGWLVAVSRNHRRDGAALCTSFAFG
jgi:aryl carrier-like protein